MTGGRCTGAAGIAPRPCSSDTSGVIDVGVEAKDGGWVAAVRVQHDGATTHHRVTVREEDLGRYGSRDPAELVRRSFAFLLEREPSTSILREFRITEIERY